MRYDFYGEVCKRGYSSFDLKGRRYEYMIDIDNFNPDTYHFWKYYDEEYYLYKLMYEDQYEFQGFCPLEFRETSQFVKNIYFKTSNIDVPLTMDYKFSDEEGLYIVKSIEYDLKEDKFNVYIAKTIDIIEIDKDKEKIFLDKVDIYNKRIEEINKQEFSLTETKKNSGVFKSIINFFFKGDK